jgi:hypothetical protein
MGGRALAAGAIALIALMAALWFTVMRDPGAQDVDPPAASKAPAPVEQPPAPPVRPSAEATARARIPKRLPPVIHGPPPSRSGEASAPAPSLGSGDAGAGPYPFNLALSDQVIGTEKEILECAEKSAKTGKRLDGMAAVSFTLANKNGKIVVETTGVEYDTMGNNAATDCMREAAKAMILETLPEGAEALVGYRKVVFKDGVLKENWLTEFSQVRPPLPPPPPPPPSSPARP